MLRTLATAAAVALAAGGCTATPSRQLDSKEVRPSELVGVEGPAPQGRFYVKAGDNDLDADLFKFGFEPPRQERITTGGRVSTVDGCPNKIIVSAAQKEVGLTDHLQEVRGGVLGPVEGLGIERGSDPHLSQDCRLLYTRPVEEGAELVTEVVRFDPDTGTSAPVAKGETLASAAWGPNGEILLLKRESTGPVFIVIRPGEPETTITPEKPDVGNPLWGTSGWIATDFAEPRQSPTGTLFINPATGERSQLDGWLALAWSPDGRQLLVAEATRGTTLAVVDLPDLTKTRNVGVSEVGTVWDAVWLPSA